MKINISNDDFKDMGLSVSQKDFYNSFIEMGFPNRKKEDWKFTDLDKILNSNFEQLTPLKKKSKFKHEKIFNFDHYSITNLNGALIDFVFPKTVSLSQLKEVNHLKKHSIFFGMRENLIPGRPTVENASKKDQMLSLNLSFLDRGYSFKIMDPLDKPLVIYNYYDDDLRGKMINNSNSIEITDSKCTIIEVDIDKSKSKYFKNTFQKYKINESEVDYYFINQNNSDGFNYTKNEVEINDLNSKKGSIFSYFIFGSGSKFRKDDYEISLNGANSFAKINSAAILKKGEHHEVKTKMFHSQPHCKSHQKIKNILLEDSKGIFQGKVLVSDKAQKTDAYQISKGLILDDNAEFSTKPELEIYADDVKCSHGSTSGNIDHDAIYYLMTRGLPKKEAIKLIIKGFLNDVVLEITDLNIKKLIEDHLEENINNEN
jgi:Fe-S cluster assembly protein SufD